VASAQPQGAASRADRDAEAVGAVCGATAGIVGDLAASGGYDAAGLQGGTVLMNAKLTFGDIPGKLAAAAYAKEFAKLQAKIAEAMKRMRVIAGRTGRRYSALAEDRNLVREFGADVMREASRRLREGESGDPPIADGAEHAE